MLAALKSAVKADRWDIAEHLLRALETLYANRVEAPPLAEAYLMLAEPTLRRSGRGRRAFKTGTRS